MRIAVIDDEKLTREELIRLIREGAPQAEICEAGSGVQAVQLLAKKTFDFLFIDVRLGDMEGTTVASLARRLMPEAKIISTALGVYEERLRGRRFYRIHKTCLVHLKYVQDIFPWSGSDFALRVRGSNVELPIGRDRLKGLRVCLHI